MSQIRGEVEDSAEGVVYLRRGRTGNFNEEVGQRLAGIPAPPE
ncbi:MAG: hypothetical protein AAB871_01135 [Patescibacteria group bacterium]